MAKNCLLLMAATLVALTVGCGSPKSGNVNENSNAAPGGKGPRLHSRQITIVYNENPNPQANPPELKIDGPNPDPIEVADADSITWAITYRCKDKLRKADILLGNFCEAWNEELKCEKKRDDLFPDASGHINVIQTMSSGNSRDISGKLVTNPDEDKPGKQFKYEITVVVKDIGLKVNLDPRIIISGKY